MEKRFGPGDARPSEHGKDTLVWRLKFNNTLFRVLTPSDGKNHSRIRVEAPEGVSSLTDPERRQDVADFMVILKKMLA